MIPLTLHIKNFLSYGSEPQLIDFGPYPLICLSGKNGHGKSALLDAITWALWGQARKTLNTSKPDQGLLRIGQTHMLVIFDFVLSNNHYRVRRELSILQGKSIAHLEFGMVNKDTNMFVPFTDKTIRSTQEIIEQTIHVDFESFTNSVFLRQGHANEFSKKSPKDRKEILASMLGLNTFDVLRKQASEKVRNASTQKQTLTALQEKYIRELEKKELLTTQLQTISQELTHIAQQNVDYEQQTHLLEQAEQLIAQEHQASSLLSFKITELTKKKQEHEHMLQEKRQLWRTIHRKQLSLQESNASLQNKKKIVSDQISTFQELLLRQIDIKEQHLAYSTKKQTYIQKHTDLYAEQLHSTEIEIESARTESNNTQEYIKHVTEQRQLLEEEVTQHNKSLTNYQPAGLEAINTEIALKDQQFERRKEYYQRFRVRGSLLQNSLQQTVYKARLSFNTHNPICPYCEQTVSPSQRIFLEQKCAATERLLTHQRNRLIHVVKTLKTMLIEQHAYLQKLRTTAQTHTLSALQYSQVVTSKRKTEESLATITQQVTNYEQKHIVLSKKITDLEKHYAILQHNKNNMLKNDISYQDITKTLHHLEKQLTQIRYNSQDHQNAQLALQQIEQKLLDYTYIQQEYANQKQRKQDIIALCQMLRTVNKELTILTKNAHTYINLAVKIKELSERKQELAEKRRKYSQTKELLLQEMGKIQAQQEALTNLQQEYLENQQKISMCDETIADYTAIAVAAGRDGLQALLIEDAIPEIEQEANELLKKLTHNQAHIFIESLRDLKKGGTKETLDINISDATGIRPYELFSGGEAFRIDFALRISISKLLARRAGTALQTLIIDEGFGSQDEDGLNQIMDVLLNIQSDFSKIIIVSHLSTMKDQFPVHFFVEKKASGSVVTVIEQD